MNEQQVLKSARSRRIPRTKGGSLYSLFVRVRNVENYLVQLNREGRNSEYSKLKLYKLASGIRSLLNAPELRNLQRQGGLSPTSPASHARLYFENIKSAYRDAISALKKIRSAHDVYLALLPARNSLARAQADLDRLSKLSVSAQDYRETNVNRS
jgi:hypothetical protein